jgi:GNAT superfamily N-acetyltransferase
VSDDGENFVTHHSMNGYKMKNICGAYCLPDYRGKCIFQNLLNFVISILKDEGYTRLGVDFESYNPTAYGFWLKYFTAYTNSVVRRIDV